MAVREDVEAKLAGSLVIDVLQVEVGIDLDLLHHKPVQTCEGALTVKASHLVPGLGVVDGVDLGK